MSDYNTSCPFGPLIYKADISGDFQNFLVDGLSASRMGDDARKHLVGNIQGQRRALNYDEDKFVKFVDPHVINYLLEKHKRHNTIKDTCSKPTIEWNYKSSKIAYDLDKGPWINFQNPSEFNPLHNHAGIISAVIFIDIPEEISKERKESTYNAKVNGCLEFVYMNQHIILNPESATLLLFPAYLWHTVYPYHSDVERITMSFNVHNLTIDDYPVPGNDDIIFYQDT